jgi:mannosyltransferase OCH1-like enzyme
MKNKRLLNKTNKSHGGKKEKERVKSSSNSNIRSISLSFIFLLCCITMVYKQYILLSPFNANDKDKESNMMTIAWDQPQQRFSSFLSSVITNNNNNSNDNNTNTKQNKTKQNKDQNKNKRLSLSEITQNPPAGSLECPPLMTPIYDRIVIDNDNGNDNDSKRKIPKMIHISSKSRCVPTDVYADGIQQWKDKLPDHSFYFHDDNAIDIFFNQDWSIEFPDIHRIMKCILYKGAMKIDVWRMLIVYEFGGWYTDIDNAPAKELNNPNITLLDEDSFFASTANKGSVQKPNQNVFAMSPKHPIADFTIQRILSNLYNHVDNIQKVAVVQVTGPSAFYTAYHEFFQLTHKGPGRYNKSDMDKPGIYNNGTFLGLQVHKGEYWNWKNMAGDENVKLDDGRWMNRKARANEIAGTPHWTTRKDVTINNTDTDTNSDNNNNNKNNNDDDIVSAIKNDPNNKIVISCKEYLYRLNHNNNNN